MMKIYTKTGDSGKTGLFAGARVAKDNPRIEAIGAVDELNAVLGVCRVKDIPEPINSVLAEIQNDLFTFGAELATPDPAAHGTNKVNQKMIESLEIKIDHFEANLTPLQQFILPGGTNAAAAIHWARAVSRRAERSVVSLTKQSEEAISMNLVIYLNRLSDLLFVLARAANAMVGQEDVPWQK